MKGWEEQEYETINYREAFIDLPHIEIRLFRDDIQIEGI